MHSNETLPGMAKEWDHLVLSAACYLGFLGFLCSAEFTAPKRGDFDPGLHLNYTDITVDNLDHSVCKRLNN